jgi:peptidoglycan/LPS O-acetylase OafA/YrhL
MRMQVATGGARLAPIPALTGLRFVAAMSVVLFHYGTFGLIRYPSALQLFSSSGSSGVSLFFVLSGFVLVYNYFDWFAADTARFSEFLRDRFARIFPMYALSLLASTVLATSVAFAVLHHLDPVTFSVTWLSDVLAVQAWPPSNAYNFLLNLPSWSISDEFFFYLVLPFFICACLSRFARVRSLITLAIGLYVAQLLYFAIAMTLVFWVSTGHVSPAALRDPHPARFEATVDLVFKFPLARIWEFLVGATLGLVYLRAARGRPGSVSTSRELQNGGPRNLAVGAALAGIAVVVASGAFGQPDSWLGLLRWYVFYTPLFALLITTLALGHTFISRVLENRYTVLLGEASYSLYILHWLPVLALLFARRAGMYVDPRLAVLAIALTVTASVLSYRLIEVPTRRLLRGTSRVRAIPAPL